MPRKSKTATSKSKTSSRSKTVSCASCGERIELTDDTAGAVRWHHVDTGVVACDSGGQASPA